MIYAVNKRTKKHKLTNLSEYNMNMYPHSQYKIVEADADGWIEWSGGSECPLPDRSKYECLIGDSNTHTDGEFPVMLKWQHVKRYKPILEPQAEQVKEWDGEGLPPVGKLILIKATIGGSMCEGAIDYIDNKHCIFHWISQPERTIHAVTAAMSFRPIRTDRERWIEAASIEAHKDAKLTAEQARIAAEYIYDAGLARLPD